MTKKLKMKIRAHKDKGVIGLWCDDVVNGVVTIETRGVAHKPVKFRRPRNPQHEGHEGASADATRTSSQRGTRKAK